MKALNIENIDLEKLAGEIGRHENEWIAVSSDNKIVGSGRTYNEAVAHAKARTDVVLFKVPPLDATLAP